MEGSFIEKLKKGMGVEEEAEEKVKEPKEKEEKTQKTEIKETSIEFETENKQELKVKKTPKKEKPSLDKAAAGREKWPKPEGQLAIDVYQTESELVIQSAIAGIKPENLDITVEGDVVTIRGERKKPVEEGGDYFSQECYWGPFSREIILPVEVDPSRIEATLKEGILTIRVPKILREKKRKIAVEG